MIAISIEEKTRQVAGKIISGISEWRVNLLSVYVVHVDVQVQAELPTFCCAVVDRCGYVNSPSPRLPRFYLL